jgi:2-oxoglutarate/2-oxoacid ferredoxin oxidoreductase subunit alpha
MKDIVVRIGGEGGEGVISCGELLTTVLARSNYEVFTFRTYPAEIKGGPAMFQVRSSDEPVLSQGNLADILVTFNEEAFQLHGHSIHPSGLLVYDPGHYSPQGSFEAYGVPLEEITLNVVKTKLGKNVVALGAMARILGLSLDLLEPTDQRSVREKRRRRGRQEQGSAPCRLLVCGRASLEKITPQFLAARISL